MSEAIFKILHVPSGELVREYFISTWVSPKFKKLYGDNPIAGLNKKGRKWTRYHDVLIAWQTIVAGLHKHNREELIHDYRIQRFDLTVSDTLTPEEITADLEVKNAKYEKRKLEQDIRYLKYRIEHAKNDMQRAVSYLPNLEKELEKLTKKLNKDGI